MTRITYLCQASPPGLAGAGFFYTEKVTLGTQTEAFCVYMLHIGPE